MPRGGFETAIPVFEVSKISRTIQRAVIVISIPGAKGLIFFFFPNKFTEVEKEFCVKKRNTCPDSEWLAVADQVSATYCTTAQYTAAGCLAEYIQHSLLPVLSHV